MQMGDFSWVLWMDACNGGCRVGKLFRYWLHNVWLVGEMWK